MADYHVHCGMAGIYAGTVMKNGFEWKNKSLVTDEAMCAVAEYLYHKKESLKFQIDGKWYRMKVE